MKIWTSEHIFNHPWETVVLAAWRKYPNPMNPNVVGIDTVDRTVDNAGTLRSHRLMRTEWGLSSWVTKLVGMDQPCYVSEHSEINTKNRTMKLRSRNLTFCSVVTIDEEMSYLPHPTDSSKTLLRQESIVTVRGVPMTDYLENIIKSTMSSKSGQGRQAIEWVISRIKEETHDIGRAARREMDGFNNNLHRALRYID
jgi:hypothetical protein